MSRVDTAPSTNASETTTTPSYLGHLRTRAREPH